MMARRLLLVVGPTAVGKTDYSIELALKYGSPVISCDSRQIYREMTIGTAVPSAAQLSAVRHYFIQTETARELYTAGKYELQALELLARLFGEGHETLVMAGGSGFYADAVCHGLPELPPSDLSLRNRLKARLSAEGLAPLQQELRELDPEACARMDLSNPQRVVRALEVCKASGRPFSSFLHRQPVQRSFEIEKIGLSRPRKELYDRIDRRVVRMMADGLLQEAESLLPYRHYTALQTVGYKELFDHFDGKCTLDEAVSRIQQHTRNYAKRQLTWWRRDPSVRWVEL